MPVDNDCAKVLRGFEKLAADSPQVAPRLVSQRNARADSGAHEETVAEADLVDAGLEEIEIGAERG